MSVLDLIRSDLLDSPAYSAGDDTIKHRLHANELPWSVLSTDSLELNFYPEIQARMCLQEELAQRYQINKDQILLTRGSDDGIDLIMRLFLRARQDAFMQFPPTFFMYAFYVRLQQAQMIQCPLDPLTNFSLTMEHIEQNWQENCKVIMLCNPNNPTGNLIDLPFIANLCARYKNRAVIVVDEAYIEFANTQSATALIDQFDNLIVLRTLSKAYGLAGLRLAAIIAQPQIIQAFNKIIPPYPLSSVVIHLARQALANTEWFATAIEKITRARTKLMNVLETNPLIEKVYPSAANFILVKTRYANEIADWFAKQGIAIRNFAAHPLLQNHLRITIGDEQQNLLLMSALSSFQSLQLPK